MEADRLLVLAHATSFTNCISQISHWIAIHIATSSSELQLEHQVQKAPRRVLCAYTSDRA